MLLIIQINCYSSDSIFTTKWTILAEMNTLMMQMRHTAHELRVTLDHVLQGGEGTVAPQNSHDESISFLSEPEAEMRMGHDIPEVRAHLHLVLITA